jgi:YgiT-type zinc finger domain-containing protein
MNENEKTRPCPSCDGVMRRSEREETLAYQGHTLTHMQLGWYCDACDEGILEDADNEVHDTALHELIARARSASIPPLAVGVKRGVVGLSQH